MRLPRTALLVLSAAVLSPCVLPAAADLAAYRSFRLGMPLADVASRAGIAAPQARLISSRPERIEELDWRINWTPPVATVQPDPFRDVLFSFYNNELFEITVTYDRDRTNGLTEADMTEAISGVYGPAAKPAAAQMTFNSGFSKTVRVIARWEDPRYQMSLVELPYDAGFGMVLLSKEVEAKSALALAESERLDREEAPRREAALLDKQLAEAQAADAKARLSNKEGFRP